MAIKKSKTTEKNMRFKSGQKVTTVNNTSGHQLPLGTIMTVIGYNGQFVRTKEYSAYNFYEVDLELNPESLEELQGEERNLDNKIRGIRSKITFLKESKKEYLEDEEYKMYMVGKILTDDESSLDDRIKNIKAVFIN